MGTKKSRRLLSLLLSGLLALPVALWSYSSANAQTGSDESAYDYSQSSLPIPESGSLTYSFSGYSPDKAGYAEGTITFKAGTSATYKLYWADDTKALEGYCGIEGSDPFNDELKLSAGESKTVSMGYHTVIPAGATKVIATTGSLYTADAAAVYDIPSYKRLSSGSGKLLYTFSSFSDLHTDVRKGDDLYWVNSQSNLKKGLNLSAKKGSDYVIISGDSVTGSSLDNEWDTYLKILSESDYVNPIWESIGNHETKGGDREAGLKKFVQNTGTDGSKSSKSYFSMIEEKTGDLFIFMSLEKSNEPNNENVFSDAQITWARDLIKNNYTKRNIFLVEHAPVKGFGAGDRMSNPYYGGLMDPSFSNNGEFKKLLQEYKNIVFISGHTHIDLIYNYNYSNENGNAANMIHNPALGGTNKPNSAATALEYTKEGINTQGYFVQVFENEIVFNGIDVATGLIYPKYSYIMEGARTSATAVNTPSDPRPLKNITADLSSELSKVSYVLSEYKSFASYDSYQALKKYYYQYKEQTTADQSVIDEFEDRITALSEYTGEINYYTLHDAYYFLNNRSWSDVYLYAWNSSNSNASWPGVKLSKTGTDTSTGKDIYKIDQSKISGYNKIIFSSGSNTNQTVDIALNSYKYNGFKIGSSENGKYTVTNFKYNDDGNDDPIPENNRYALLYYVSDLHGWDSIDTFLKYDGGVYKIAYKQSSENNLSFSLYDKKEGRYYSLSESLKITYSAGSVNEVTLEKMSSRGKSVTVYGMNKDCIVNIEFDTATKALKVTCGAIVVQEELENTSFVSDDKIKIGSSFTVNASAKGGSGEYTYAVFYKKSSSVNWTQLQDFGSGNTVNVKPAKAVKYDVLVKVKDSAGKIAEKTFTVDVYDVLKNTSTVASEKIGFGDKIVVNAKATGGIGKYTFAVYCKKSSSEKWSTAQKFSENSVVTLSPAAAVPYDVMIKVKDERGVIVKKTITVNVSKPENTSSISSDEITLGKRITVSCSAKNGSGVYKYAVLYKKASSDKWTVTQNYSSNASVSIKPAVKTSYEICVKVKDGFDNISKKYFTVNVK